MALLDNVFKQRMVGALVLIALAVIFLPMLFSREDELRQVRVDAPQAPQAPVLPEVKVDSVPVPEPQPLTSEAQAQEEQEQQEQDQQAQAVPATAEPIKAAPSMPIKPMATAPSKPAAARPAPVQPVAATPAKADTAPKIDPNGLPISWSIQLASLATRASADGLQKTLRSQGYNAYVRSADGKNRVFVGPLIDRAEAERVRDVIARQQNIKGIVVRFAPEKG
ncbi:SPOR domain-containing protein [Pseudomonas sp. dw_358]|uniref:SPOR domain-containing protein n=1 Tax=Pseudomonas sp. dw_358 TaxID=2720083 RepID=UPI001BD66EAA|nr:SPOR domain-containing protein [Pseudomonas sp. dw_358]